VTTFELPGCVDMWTVLSGDQVIDLVSMDCDVDTIQCNAMQCNAVQYNAVQYNTINFYKIKIYYVKKTKENVRCYPC